MAHYLNGGGSKLELNSHWSRKLMDDPGISVERERLLNAFLMNNVRNAADQSGFSVTPIVYRGLDFYSWDDRPKPESAGLYSAVGHVAINGEFSAEAKYACHSNGYVVRYSARYFIDASERYEWFWDSTTGTGTETNFGNLFGTGEIVVPHKWAVALRDASPPRAHEYDFSATVKDHGRVLFKRYSWRILEWWEILD